ncbi:hypothetical protein RIF29_28567 [Crotalaria pallida]|uniref:Uncharacterized protein n=1 Tax=Crotalaria pallida TaxID=3830 RepID=A0AAN9EDC9_CROPI
MEETLTYDCFARIMSLTQEHDHENASLVAKAFLSLTNELRTSLNVFHNTVLTLLPRFPNVSSLSFHGLPYSEMESALLKISESALNIKYLDVSNHSAIPRRGLTCLAEKVASSLISLNCSKMGKLNGWDIRIIAECFPLLEHLDISYPQDSMQRLSYSGIEDSDSPVCPSAFKAMCLELPNLRSINLSGNFLLKDDMLLFLCNNSSSLEELAVVQCCYLTPSCIASAISSNKKLKSVSLGAKFNRDVGRCLSSLRTLSSIELVNARICDGFLRSIGESRLPLAKLILEACVGYSFVGLRDLSSRCDLITHLGIEYANFLEDENMVEISLLLGKRLRIVQLGHCTNLTELTFFAITRNCNLLCDISMEKTSFGQNEVQMDIAFVNPNVTYIDLSYNDLANTSLHTLVILFPNVKKLILKGCQNFSDIRRWSEMNMESLNFSRTRINDDFLVSISTWCNCLLSLNLDGCSKITGRGVMRVIKSCKKLREITLTGCYRVKANVIALMVLRRPTLRRISVPRSCDVRSEVIVEKEICSPSFILVRARGNSSYLVDAMFLSIYTSPPKIKQEGESSLHFYQIGAFTVRKTGITAVDDHQEDGFTMLIPGCVGSDACRDVKGITMPINGCQTLNIRVSNFYANFGNLGAV